MKTSLQQKFLLLALGVFLAIFILEIGLRTAGGVVLYLQQRHNHVSFSQNEYRILCLGESTTALGGEDSYPSQLEEMLNAAKPQVKFTVINKGIISTTSDLILAHLGEYLDTYKPRLAIVMMGINDPAYMHAPYRTYWWENIKFYLKDSRVYKLVHLLYEHIIHRIQEPASAESKAPDQTAGTDDQQRIENFLRSLIKTSLEQYQYHASRHEEEFAKRSIVQASMATIQLAERYRLEGSFQEAQHCLEGAAVLTPNYTAVYQQWGELYLSEGNYDQAVISFQAALTIDPKNSAVLPGLARALHQEHKTEAFLVYADYLHINSKDYWGYIELAQWLKQDKHYDLALGFLDRAIQVGPDFEQGYVDLGEVLDDQGLYGQEEAFYLKEITLHPKSPRLYQALGQFYLNHGRKDLSKEYFQKAAQQEAAGYYPATFVNYALIVNKLLQRHIKVIVMQYPVRNIAPLKDYLGQKEGMYFVENRQNFKQAINKKGFSYYFKDNFAYDFGHCTRAGNELIARNLNDVILREVLVPLSDAKLPHAPAL